MTPILPQARYAQRRKYTGLADLTKIANMHRPFPSAFMSASGTGVTQAYRDYALPLLGESLPRSVRLPGA